MNGDSKSNRSCGCCKSVKRLLRKKIIRSQQTKKRNYLKLSKLNPRNQQKIKVLLWKVKTRNRGKQRANTQLRLLITTVKNIQDKMRNISQDSVDKLLARHKTISDREVIAVKEIFKAVGTKDPRGRRYSDECIIQSILLHMRSPAAYRIIFENKTLPVPCVRIIRR